MARAIELAASPGVPSGPNPRVGCVVLSPTGDVIGEGFHGGAGTPHAEVIALTAAGAAAPGATLVLTLEPCNHTGRTPPCSEAIVKAGIARVVYAQADPDPVAAGGTAALLAAGVDVEAGVAELLAAQLNPEWTVACRRGRPFVTLKLSSTLDGRIAAADGSSRWITGSATRRDVHELRNQVDAVLTGTATVLRDDPELTVRESQLIGSQPIRVVVGERDIPATARILNPAASTIVLRTRDLDVVLTSLYQQSIRHVLVEAGATLATAFVKARLVDRLRWYVAPAVLGAGTAALADLGITSISAAIRWHTTAVAQVGDDVRIDMAPLDINTVPLHSDGE